MKSQRTFLVPVFVALALVGCSKDDTPVTPDPADVAYTNASSTKGGIMYDNFWATESGFNQADPNLSKFSAYSDFFRCKQCHGWDLLGTTGSYNNRGPKTNRPNVSTLDLYQIAHSKSAKELFDAMKKSTGRRDISFDLATYDPASNATEGDKMPNYAQILTDAQMWDIVKFMREGAFDVKQLYDATYTGTYPTGKATFANLGRDGNAANGKQFFTSKCVTCHGADGKTFQLENMSLGKFARSKPNEVQHKVMYGQLGSIMIGQMTMSLAQMKDLYKALADTTAFPD